MDIVIGIVGVIIGLFLWSNVLGSVFATYPAEKRRIDENKQASISWARIVIPIIISLLIIIVVGYLSTPFLIGTTVSFFIMLFNIKSLKKEEQDKRR